MFKTTALAAAASALAFAHAGNAALVAYFPVDSATDSSNFLNDTIDDATHGVADGTTSNNTATILFDATRGGDVVLSPQGHRYSAGTQDIDLNTEGFTWSLWYKTADNSDGGADVIIGSRNGRWNKVQPTGTARFFDLGGYNVDDGAWYHLAYTGEPGTPNPTGEFWVNGTKVATDTNGVFGSLDLNDVMEIGGSSKFSEDVNGYLDDIAIYDEVLSDDDIIALSNGADPQSIPEPSSLALLGLGGLLIARRRRA